MPVLAASVVYTLVTGTEKSAGMDSVFFFHPTDTQSQIFWSILLIFLILWLNSQQLPASARPSKCKCCWAGLSSAISSSRFDEAVHNAKRTTDH